MKEAAHNSLDQLNSVLNTLDHHQYSKALEIFNGSSIGQYTRHIIELFQALFQTTNHINYDDRVRSFEIENSIPAAQQAIQQIQKKINLIGLNQNISIEVSAHPKHSAYKVPSNMGRELLYNIEHCTHHLAIIKLGLKSDFPEIELNQNIGKAPATLKHEQKCAQ